MQGKMIHTFLSQWARQSPERTVITQAGRRVTYGELERSTNKIASFLVKNGMQPGERVGILSKNSPEYIAAYLGVQRARGVAVDINFQDSAHEIKTIINHCGVTILIAESAYAAVLLDVMKECPSIKNLIAIEGQAIWRGFPKEKIPTSVQSTTWELLQSEEDGLHVLAGQSDQTLAAIVYTSGTTGRPKGVKLSHENIVANARSIVEYLRLTCEDKIMVVLPFCYSYGKSLLTTHLMAGGELVLENSFMYPNAVFDKMAVEGVTGFAGVPSTFSIMLNRSNFAQYRFPKLRYVTQAGGAMPPQHAQELSVSLPGTEIFIMYGQTEATARLTFLKPSDLHRKRGSIGKAIPGVEIKVLRDGEPAAPGEEGEIVARGANIMLGYWNDEDATWKTLRNGWLHTGDMAFMDEEGYLTIVGRNSDMIKSGAHRISPKEIEEAILELPGVFETAVLGVPDDILGETIKAVVVLKPGHSIDAHMVQRHCQTRLASFKIPKEVVFTGSLPKTSSGKIIRYKLRNDHPDSVFAAAPKAEL